VMEGSRGVWVKGRKARAHREGQWWSLDGDVSGTARVEER
jgi:hypothetical protein